MVFWHWVAMAQTEAIARLDSNSIVIGDQINLEISFTCPADYKVKWPQLRDTLISEVEIIKKTPVDSLISSSTGSKSYHQILTITSFDSGYYALPPVRFNYTMPGDAKVHFTETDALLLEVRNVKVDTAGDIKDIKAPLEAPFSFREALPYILVLFVAALISYLVILYLRKRKKAEPIFKTAFKPHVPPHRLALDNLEALRYKKLWQNGKIKEYHTELTDIVREYLAGNFSIHAQEFTSHEIMLAVDKTAANDTAKEKLHQTLLLADLVKFAKLQPLPIEHDGSLNNAIDFVKETMHLNPVQIQPINDPHDKVMPPANENETLVEAELNENEGKEVKDVE